MPSIAEFVKELQRRSVIRAAIVHVLFFWLLVQVADVVLPYIGIVDDPVRWAILAGVGLFPLTLIVAWFFEHPWTRFTRGRVATDIFLIVLIGVGATTWVMRNLPQVVHTKTSIVVMPFAHSGDVTEASLSRALASEVNSLLMKSNSIDVIGIESSTSSVLDGLDAPAIANRLDVQHILTGTITADAGKLRIDLRLLDRAGEALWNSIIEDNLENLFSIQEDIATSIESQLGVGDDAVPVAEIAASRCWMPNDSEAIENFYTARYYAELRTDTEDAKQKLRDAIEIYGALIEQYPEFAEAHSGLAWAIEYQATYDRENAIENHRAEASRIGAVALEHCPTLGEAMHLTPNQFDHPNPWIGQHQQLTAFIEMEPQRSENHQRLAHHYRHTGFDDRAIEVAKRNYERNPLSVRSIKEYAGALQYAGFMEEAAELYDLATELGSTSPNFARQLIPLRACDDDDIDCIIAGVEGVFGGMLFDGWEDFFRRLYTAPETDEEAAAIIDMAMAKVRETEGMMVNWLNGTSCNYKHLTPLFFELIDYVKAEGHIGRDWYFPNGWGAECVNVWSHPRFRDYVEEFGFIEYWRKIDAWPPACRSEGDSFTCGSG
jgi:TolB-like protein